VYAGTDRWLLVWRAAVMEERKKKCEIRNVCITVAVV
jgi:hypothetical protein